MSEIVDSSLERLIETWRDVAAYLRCPLDEDEIALGSLPVKLGLDDADVDYDALYGEQDQSPPSPRHRR